jgi:[ribosomal protein S5]-alanine N-acetyltransferase
MGKASSAICPDAIETRRLALRRPRLDDAQAIFERYAQDREVTRYLMWLPHQSVATTSAFLAKCQTEWQDAVGFGYVITRKPADDAIGMIDLRLNGMQADLGYVLARPHWGEGLMPEAASALVAIALGQSAIVRVQAICDVDNRASARVLERAGLLFEGMLHKHVIHPNISAEPRDVRFRDHEID